MQDKKRNTQMGTRLLSSSAPRLTALGRVGAAIGLLGLPLAMPSAAHAQLVISELRLTGPAGGLGATTTNAADEFVEIFNPTNSAISLDGWSIQYRLTGQPATTSTAIALGREIPALGHYLLAGRSNTLNTLVPRDQVATPSGDIAFDSAVTLLNGATPVDTVDVGDPRPGFVPTGVQFSFVRRSFAANDNNFVLVAPVPEAVSTPNQPANPPVTIDGLVPVFGAPGPQALASQSIRNDLPVTLFDTQRPVGQTPNRVRDQTVGNINNASFGTIRIRRTVTNNTDQPISSLRFRATAITTSNGRALNQADVRLLTTANETGVARSSPQPVGTPLTETVFGTSLQSPSSTGATGFGGGLNSSVIVLGTSIPAGQSRSFSFLLGVEATGNFSITLDLEALPAPGTTATTPSS